MKGVRELSVLSLHFSVNLKLQKISLFKDSVSLQSPGARGVMEEAEGGVEF